MSDDWEDAFNDETPSVVTGHPPCAECGKGMVRITVQYKGESTETIEHRCQFCDEEFREEMRQIDEEFREEGDE